MAKPPCSTISDGLNQRFPHVSPPFFKENFFDTGGHSALAAKMATELSSEYHLPVTAPWQNDGVKVMGKMKMDIYINTYLSP